MFAKTIIDSDAFLEMPVSARLLYYDLSMRADDDGFLNNPKKIQRMIGCSEDDLKLLIAKNFIIPFESGVVVIKHWKIHNYIRNDRYKETVYKEEKALLETKENKAYTLGIPNGYQMDTQDRLELGKDKLGKIRVVEGSESASNNSGNLSTKNDDLSTDSKFELQNGTLGRGVVLLTPEQDEALLEKLGFDGYNHYVSKLAAFIIEKDAKVGNHYATILKWAKEDSVL